MTPSANGLRFAGAVAALLIGSSFFGNVSAEDRQTVSKVATGLGAEDLKSSIESLVDIDGEKHESLKSSKVRAAVLLFVLADCPISNSYSQEFNRLDSDYAAKGIEFYLVHPDPLATNEIAKRHAQDYELKLPVILDPEHRIVKAVGASVTPEAAVVTSKGGVVYLGRLDDRYTELGKRSERVSSTELRDALDAILEDRTIARPRVKAVGCSIGDLK